MGSFFFDQYMRSLSPIIIPCLLIPVASFKDSPDWYRVFQKEINPLYGQRHYMELDKNFVFSKLTLEQGRWWTACTYMFRHTNFAHLIGNMGSLLWFSTTLLAELGKYEYYLIFFGSGVLAALDSQGKGLDINSGIDRMFNMIKPIPDKFSNSWISRTWDKMSKKVSHFATPFVSPFLRYMGASAGIYGIIGATLCSDIISLFDIVYNPRYDGKDNIAFLLLNIASIVYKISNEIEMSRSGEGFLTGVDSAGHVTGFTAGVIIYIFLRWRRAYSPRINTW